MTLIRQLQNWYPLNYSWSPFWHLIDYAIQIVCLSVIHGQLYRGGYHAHLLHSYNGIYNVACLLRVFSLIFVSHSVIGNNGFTMLLPEVEPEIEQQSNCVAPQTLSDTIAKNLSTFNITKIYHIRALDHYIPRIRRIGGCYGFTSKPPAARRPQWC